MNSMTDNIVFATNFSDACHAAIPAVTRWIDSHKADLTLLHVYDPSKILRRDAESQLNSFYAEADNYRNCRRVLLAGDPCESIKDFCARERNGLLFMPPSDRTGLPRPFHVSSRARLLESLDMPIWTMGKATLSNNAAVAGKNIAVYLQDLDRPSAYISAAASHAQRHGATLHLFYIVPETTEGTLITSLHTGAPLGIETAIDMIGEIAAGLPSSLKIQIHVRMGSESRELKALLRESEAELLIVGSGQTIHRGFFRTTINSTLTSCEIPILCLPESIRLHPGRRDAAQAIAA
ncbi:Universal stress protein family protein [Granulicella pectinivorans]|jgi:nucleotide-binding universal stress UspA family protein|uniref:Universal stress protein family protein n=1 Tax=Granulicella pectinivorans TaxID=474950 RepID=A0A1I6MC36_9BACT|nr:universal stress protein [Granulicella pectinivorans]SFS13310.1 Universal stress protein family protein [Granulicella pectinivorans]